MKILGIETSCDETAAAVVEDGRKMLSSVVASQIEKHKAFGGVVPEIASRCHIETISGIAGEAVERAGCGYKDIDGVAVTFAPGLIGALLVGVNFAKGLALALDKPLIPVHHLRSHIAANYLAYENLKPPFLSLVVSGGHSHIIMVKDYTKFKIIGKTHDDAAGEAFDKTARAMGLPYPGGIYLDRLAEEGDPESYKLPRPQVENRPLDFSFSGLKTAVINIIHKANQKGEEYNKANLASSTRFAIVDILKTGFLKGAEETGMKTLVLAGGVTANSLLRTTLTHECKERGYNLFMPPVSLCGDNAAMVASQGYYEFLSGNIADQTLNAFATMPVDYVKNE